MIEIVVGKVLIRDPARAASTSRVYVPVPWGVSLPTATTYVPVTGGINEISGSGELKTIDPIDISPLELMIGIKLPLASRVPIARLGSARVPLPSVAPCAINTYRSPAVRSIECKSNVSGVEIWLRTGVPFATIGVIATSSSL